MRNLLSTPSVVLSAFALLLGVGTSAAHAQLFSNATPIGVPANSIDGRGTLYPSPIVVSGAPTSIGYVSVTLNGFSHTWADDVNVLLVSPSGQKIVLMSNCNGSGDAAKDTLTFTPDSAATLPALTSNVASGVYACSVYSAPDALPTPAPAGPYADSLAPLIGTNANGTWNLYVVDDFATEDSGTFAGGWSISFSSTAPGPVATAFTYQGVLAAGGAPINGSANVRFTLCSNPTVPTDFSAVGSPLTRAFTDVAGGLITTSLDFGAAFDANQSRWLNIEVESPPGSGFVTLSPRPAITPVPQARVAQFAASATNANTATSAQSVPWSGVTGVPANVSNAFSPWVAGASSTVNYTAGNVGIGIAAPTSTLDVVSGNIFEQVRFASPFTQGTWLTLQNSSTGGRPWQLVSTGSTNLEAAGAFLIRDGTATAVRMTFLPNGNVGIGTTTPSQRLQVNGNVLANNVAVPSSGRFKHNVAPMGDALDKLLRLDGVTFDWNADFAKDRPGREHDIGFVAEDVAKVFPEVVFYDAEGKVSGMDYSRLTAVAVQAIKQQQTKFAAELAKRDAENAELKARLAAIEAALKQMNTDKK